MDPMEPEPQVECEPDDDETMWEFAVRLLTEEGLMPAIVFGEHGGDPAVIVLGYELRESALEYASHACARSRVELAHRACKLSRAYARTNLGVEFA